MCNILNWLSKFLGVEIEYWQIDCNTKKTIREKIINNFKETTKIAILINVHILDEGINIPECDSVFITQPSNNMINIIQRMCRANRITENKNNCNIYLWCKEKKADIILNYIFENTNEFIKDKVFIYNTEKKIIGKHIITKLIENNNINDNINDNIITINKLKEYIKDNNLLINFDLQFIDDFYFYLNKIDNNDIIINIECAEKIMRFYLELQQLITSCKNYFILTRNDFISFSDTIYWINVERDNLVKTLNKRYKEGKDYFIINKNEDDKLIKLNFNAINNKCNRRKYYKLTIDCFKKIAINSNSKNGRLIKQYHLNNLI